MRIHRCAIGPLPARPHPMINYHDRRFVPVSNSANGEVSPEVVFH